MPFLARAGAVVLLLASSACGEVPLEPNAITGVWALETVDHQSLPAVVSSDASLTVLLLADTLALSPDGSYEGSRCELRVNVAEQATTSGCRPYAGTYHLRVRELELRERCSLALDCIGTLLVSATLEADRLVLRTDAAGPVLGYVRTD